MSVLHSLTRFHGAGKGVLRNSNLQWQRQNRIPAGPSPGHSQKEEAEDD